MSNHDHHQATGHGHARQPDAHGQLDVREQHIGDPPAPAGYNVFAIPLAAGASPGLGSSSRRPSARC